MPESNLHFPLWIDFKHGIIPRTVQHSSAFTYPPFPPAFDFNNSFKSDGMQDFNIGICQKLKIKKKPHKHKSVNS